jgi:hypothetical protein
VKHYVFSTLPSMIELTKGKFQHVSHFEQKNDVAEYIRKNCARFPFKFFPPYYD